MAHYLKNVYAKALAESKYRQRIVISKKIYNRKKNKNKA
jgi:hypothetical protein